MNTVVSGRIKNTETFGKIKPSSQNMKSAITNLYTYTHTHIQYHIYCSIGSKIPQMSFLTKKKKSKAE